VTPLKQVLVVDDDPDLLAVVSLSLTALGGYKIESCNSSEKAVEAARSFAPDLILLDVMMPGLDGFGVLRALREVGETESIPVVFMSAHSDRQQIAEYVTLGSLGVITKPFDPIALPGVLEDFWVLHSRRRMDAHQREFEGLRRSYIRELADKMATMRTAATALAEGGWDRSRVELLAHGTHGSAWCGGSPPARGAHAGTRPPG
jgi:two-component system OmpR family response regulator